MKVTVQFRNGSHVTAIPYYEMKQTELKREKVRERNIPTERTPLVGEISANLLRVEGATWSA
jgi:hypothetical protein